MMMRNLSIVLFVLAICLASFVMAAEEKDQQDAKVTVGKTPRFLARYYGYQPYNYGSSGYYGYGYPSYGWNYPYYSYGYQPFYGYGFQPYYGGGYQYGGYRRGGKRGGKHGGRWLHDIGLGPAPASFEEIPPHHTGDVQDGTIEDVQDGNIEDVNHGNIEDAHHGNIEDAHHGNIGEVHPEGLDMEEHSGN